MKVSLMGLGDQVRDPVTGNREDAAQRHRAMVEAAVVADETGEFDHHSADFAAGWRGQYRDIRATCPVMRVDAQGGFVLLTRYEDIKHVLLAPKEFASGRDLELDGVPGTVTGGVTVPANPFRMGMMEMDAPESVRLRKILLPWFSARAVELNAVYLRDLVTWCLDRVIESGRCDVVDDLANPLPALATLDLMGLPLENWERYARVLHGAVYREKGSARELAWLQGDLRAIVTERRVSPPAVPTPVDALLAAEADGVPLPTDLVVELVYMLLSGGIDISTALIAHGLRYLSGHPELAAELRGQPDLVPGAILLTEVLTRMPDLRVDEDAVRPYETIPLVGGFRAMPATFTPGPKTGRFPAGGLPPARGERDRLRAAQAAAGEPGGESA